MNIQTTEPDPRQISYRYAPPAPGQFALTVWKPHGLHFGAIIETPEGKFRFFAWLPGLEEAPVPVDEFDTLGAAITFVENMDSADDVGAGRAAL